MENIFSCLAVQLALCVRLLGVTAAALLTEKSGVTLPWVPNSGLYDACANVECQQGTCIPNNDDNMVTRLIFPYKCQCNSGWATLESVIPLLVIPTLPCNIPNCTMNLTCTSNSLAAAAAPTLSSLTEANSSACVVPGICGRGRCEVIKNSTIVPLFKCVCDPGFVNVLNLTAGFCVSECEIGGTCQNLGIALPGLNLAPPMGTPQTTADQSPFVSAGCEQVLVSGGIYGCALGVILCLLIIQTECRT